MPTISNRSTWPWQTKPDGVFNFPPLDFIAAWTSSGEILLTSCSCDTTGSEEKSPSRGYSLQKNKYKIGGCFNTFSANKNKKYFDWSSIFIAKRRRLKPIRTYMSPLLHMLLRFFYYNGFILIKLLRYSIGFYFFHDVKI